MKACDIRLLGERVLVETDKPEDITKSGIVIASKTALPPLTGTVIQKGPGITVIHPDTKEEVLLKMEIEAGDRIIFAKHAGIPWEPLDKTDKTRGNKYIVINYADILAVI